MALRDAPRRFASSLATLLPGAVSVPLPGHSRRPTDGGLDEASAESFPASDPPAAHGPSAEADAAPVNGTGADPEPPVPNHEPIEVDLADGTWTEIDHGHVVIAAITSCTNTSNPSVMLAAGLLAKKAVERGLTVAPWVKTSLAPGSRVVIDYYERAGLLPYLEKLGFHLVGYGCTTCIGNSGPVDPAIAAVSDRLALVSVLSGNRNFEGRINPDVRMNYLASPPLVVAYALAGTMQADLLAEPLGTGSDGTQVFLADLWPSPTEVADAVRDAVRSDMFRAAYGEVFDGDDRWNSLDGAHRSPLRVGRQLHLRAPPPYFDGMPAEPAPLTDVVGARCLAKLGDSVTTDHISPAGSIKPDGPAGRWLREHGVEPADFNSYGSRRGNHEVMVRGTFANIRLRNQLAPGTEGGVTRHQPSGDDSASSTRRSATRPRASPSSSSRARSTAPARRATGRRRAPRCSASARCSPRASSASTGRTSSAWACCRCSSRRATRWPRWGSRARSRSTSSDWPTWPRARRSPAPSRSAPTAASSRVVLRIDTPKEADYFRHGGILQYVLRQLAAKG